MKNLTLSVLLVVAVLGMMGTLQSQEAAPPKSEVGVAIIDMAAVFKAYKKFAVLREDLKKDIEGAELDAKLQKSQIDTLEGSLETARKAKDNDTAAALRGEIARAKDGLESFRKSSQKDFLKQESEVYRQIYVEVQDAVEAYSRARGIRLVLRASLDSLSKDAQPQDVLTWMNRQVVYQERVDMTEEIIRVLNEKYAAAGGPAK